MATTDRRRGADVSTETTAEATEAEVEATDVESTEGDAPEAPEAASHLLT